MKMYPKVRSVAPLENKRLLVVFDNNEEIDLSEAELSQVSRLRSYHVLSIVERVWTQP